MNDFRRPWESHLPKESTGTKNNQRVTRTPGRSTRLQSTSISSSVFTGIAPPMYDVSECVGQLTRKTQVVVSCLVAYAEHFATSTFDVSFCCPSTFY